MVDPNKMRHVYAKYLAAPVDGSAILFESFHGKEISDTPLAMARALLEMPGAGDYRLYFSTTDMDRDEEALKKLGLDQKIGLAHIHSEEYARLLATAGILINNSSFPSYTLRRDGQTYLQTWHGTPWKTLGRSMKGELATMQGAQHNFIQASHLLFPNEFTREVIMRDYVLEDIFCGRLIMNGYPRNSVFSDPAKALEVKRLCGDEHIHTLAYMPTWRGQDNKNIENEDYVREMLGMLREMDSALADDQKLYVNLHPIIQTGIDLSGFEHIRAFPRDIEKYDFINSVDALITDYSSILFDYSITGKPVILFVYDYENYASERGMYFGIEELPFVRAYTMDEMKEILSSKSYLESDYSGDMAYRERFLGYDSVDAARDMMGYILAESKGGAGDAKLKARDCSFNAEKPRRVLDCEDIPTAPDLDTAMREVKEGDIVIFHQSRFEPKAERRFREAYDGKFPYVFTTEATPETEAEAKSGSTEIKKELETRNLRRRVGPLRIESSVKVKLARVEFAGIKTKGSMLQLNMRALNGVGEIKRICLEYRSDIEEIVHDMDFSTSNVKGGDTVEIDARFDMSALKKGCLYWDIYAVAGEGDDHYPVMLSRDDRKKLRRGYYQCELGDYIAFPHISLSRSLAFTLREKSPYDNRWTRFKEVLAPTVTLLLGRSLRKRDIRLVFEKFSSAAQDNGYYFFKYCMENLPADQKKDIYYVIDKKSKDYANVSRYGRNVVQFMSFRHLLYAINAKVYVGSDSRKHLYAWRPKPNLISIRMASVPIHFLQHGVTALKRSGELFGVHGSSPMTSVTATSDYEQKILEDYWGYSHANAPVLGFTRWDVLEDKRQPGDPKMVLVMPTWRAWLEEKPDEDFLASDYYKNYSALLKDDALLKTLEETDTKLIFFIHPKFKDYLDKFGEQHKNVELVQFGTRPLNEIMMKCDMLVTDYSSVCWDVYYMAKPVLFWQFDYDLYMEQHGSYMDMEHELFGERYVELDDVTKAIRECIEGGFRESERAASMRSRYFTYIDNDNSKRTYEYLKKRY